MKDLEAGATWVSAVAAVVFASLLALLAIGGLVAGVSGGGCW